MNLQSAGALRSGKTARRWAAIVGPAASGKSTLAKALSRKSNVYIVQEPLPADELDALGDLVHAESGAGVALQRAIITGRYVAASSAPLSDLVIFDRSLTEDREVFFKLHREFLRDLTADEADRLDAECRSYESELGPPLCYIELTAGVQTLRTRLLNDQSLGWLRESLPQQLEYYQQWLATDTTPRLVIHTDIVSSEEVVQVSAAVVDGLNDGLTASQGIIAAQRRHPAGVDHVNVSTISSDYIP